MTTYNLSPKQAAGGSLFFIPHYLKSFLFPEPPGDDGGGSEPGNSDGGGLIISPPPVTITYGDDRSQNEISKFIEEIFQDCMGSKINTLLTGRQITIQYDINGIFPDYARASSNGLLRWNVDNESVILEEMIHMYQFNSGSYDASAKLNMEVEAKIGIYMYARRNGKEDELLGSRTSYYGLDYFYYYPSEVSYLLALDIVRNDLGYYQTGFMDNPNYHNIDRLRRLMEDC